MDYRKLVNKKPDAFVQMVGIYKKESTQDTSEKIDVIMQSDEVPLVKGKKKKPSKKVEDLIDSSAHGFPEDLHYQEEE